VALRGRTQLSSYEPQPGNRNARVNGADHLRPPGGAFLLAQIAGGDHPFQLAQTPREVPEVAAHIGRADCRTRWGGIGLCAERRNGREESRLVNATGGVVKRQLAAVSLPALAAQLVVGRGLR